MKKLSLPTDSGIYMITNTVNQKFYVGSALNIRERAYGHIHHLRTQKHHNPKLQAAWDKYKEDAFVFSVLEIVPDRTNLIACEQKWLDHYDVANRFAGGVDLKMEIMTLHTIGQHKIAEKRFPDGRICFSPFVKDGEIRMDWGFFYWTLDAAIIASIQWRNTGHLDSMARERVFRYLGIRDVAPVGPP